MPNDMPPTFVCDVPDSVPAMIQAIRISQATAICDTAMAAAETAAEYIGDPGGTTVRVLKDHARRYLQALRDQAVESQTKAAPSS